MIHPLADVQSNHIGKGTQIWQFAVVLKGAQIGANCNINCHTFIENDVIIGNNVTVKSGTYIWDGIRIRDNVFIGPSVVFTNDLTPRSKKRVAFVKTVIQQGASIGANSSILAGITIGKYAMIGMGALVTKNIPDFALAYGQPAKIQGWVDEEGNRLTPLSDNQWISPNQTLYKLIQPNKLIKVS